jgi:regulator of sigma E protease
LSENLIINKSFEYKYGFIASIQEWFKETYYQTRLTFSGLKILLSHIIFPETPEERTQAIEQVAWPIGIVNVITQSLQWGLTLLIILWAIISINLWVFNLLPIPALDGGRLLLLWIRTAIDKVFWKTALSGNIENMIHVLFFILLIALSILIAYNDIIKLL